MKFLFQPVNHAYDFEAAGGASDSFAGLLTAPAKGSVAAVSFRPRWMSMTCFQLPRQNADLSMKTSFLTASTVRGLVASLTLAIAQLVHAHAIPIHEVPAAGATVSSLQNSVAIDFDDGLESAFSAITVTDARGMSVTSGKAVVDPSNAKHMWVALNALMPGAYTVTWVAVAADGHRTQSEYTFTVK
jgi:copper resistance protein C